MTRSIRTVGALILALCATAGCGGGSGSQPSVLPAPASASPSPSAATGMVTVTGTAIDDASGARLPAAAIGIDARAGHLDASGTGFTLQTVAGDLIAITVTAPGYATAIVGRTVPPGGGALAPVRVIALDPESTQWLARVNADRAANGNPVPLAAGTELMRAAARESADEAANAYEAHWNTSGQSAGDQCALAGAPPCAQNAAYGFPTTASVEDAFVAERSSCPNDRPGACPYTEATGHFLNIVTASGAIGLGISHALGGIGYIQNFAPFATAVTGLDTTPPHARTGAPVTFRFRVTVPGAYGTNWYHTTCPWRAFSGPQLAAASPLTPYPATCTETNPTGTGLTLVQEPGDSGIYDVTGVPLVPGTYSFGLFARGGWAGVAVVDVPS